MIQEQNKVKEWMKAFQQDAPDFPVVPDFFIRRLRYLLIKEELHELKQAMSLHDLNAGGELNPDFIKPSERFKDVDSAAVADAIADLLYVVYGTAVSFGIDMEEIFDAVHASNMAKANGHKDPVTGKWIKPADWQPPDIGKLLDKQSVWSLRCSCEPNALLGRGDCGHFKSCDLYS